MLTKIGFKKERDFEGEILFERNNLVFKCYSELNDNIRQFEKEIWGYNSDPDFNDIPLWKCYTVEDNEYIFGYVILSKRYFDNGEIGRRVSIPNEISKTFLDVEDFVMVDTKRIARIVDRAISIMVKDVTSGNFDGFVINPNDYSKSFVKRLNKLGLPIKYYNYPKFRPVGYEAIKGL